MADWTSVEAWLDGHGFNSFGFYSNISPSKKKGFLSLLKSVFLMKSWSLGAL